MIRARKVLTVSRLLKAVALALCLALIISILGFGADCAAIRGSVLRLHVLANSDSDEDQALKLKVRDAVIDAASGLVGDAQDEAEAVELARERLPRLRAAAAETVAVAGYDYPVTVEIARMYFTTRQYDTVTLPAGMYDAVRVSIGAAAGQNWWCVVFPPICLPSAVSHKTMEDVLDAGQQEIVSVPEKYEVRLAVVEWFEAAVNAVRGWFS